MVQHVDDGRETPEDLSEDPPDPPTGVGVDNKEDSKSPGDAKVALVPNNHHGSLGYHHNQGDALDH